MYTMRQAREALGIDQKTLVDWLRRDGLYEQLAEDRYDKRVRLVSEEQLGHLMAAHRRERAVLPAPSRPSVQQPPTTSESAPTRVQRHTTKNRPKAPSEREPLPDDWIAFNTEFCEAHGNLDSRSIDREREEYGVAWPLPHVRENYAERWRGHGDHWQPVKSAYDLEQHRQAAKLAAKKWPQKFISCDLCRDHLV